MKVLIASLVLAALAGCASQSPRWARDDVKAQAAAFCEDHAGIDRIQPISKNGGGNYWLRCNDKSMHRIGIKIVTGANNR